MSGKLGSHKWFVNKHFRRSFRHKEEEKRDVTDIDCLHGEVASVTGTLTLDASGLGAKDVLFSDVPFPLPFFPPVKHGNRYSRQQFRNCKNGDRSVPEYIEKILMDEKKARNAAG